MATPRLHTRDDTRAHTHPAQDDIDLHGEQESVQQHKQPGDAVA